MSDLADTDLRAILARIDRDLAESAKLREESNKFTAEQHKLNAEAQKLAVEAQKLAVEAQKLNRDRWLAPWLAIAGLIGGMLAIANFLSGLLRPH